MTTPTIESPEAAYQRRAQIFAQAASAEPPASAQRAEAWTPAQCYAHRDRMFRTMGGA